ncbi:MAG: hypothetical protein JWO06_2279 [Bacteroidota bacterium]|nr:hypothetical protein [Bacteroidota bacterium]
MKAKFTVGLFVAFISFGATSYRSGETISGINFYQGTYKQALEEAKKQNKLIFIDAYASWCGPCKLLAKSTFTDKNVAEYFNEHFINLSVDMEKGEGPMLASKYKVTHFPTLIITDENGSRITFTVGYIQPDDMLGFGKYGVQKAPGKQEAKDK